MFTVIGEIFIIGKDLKHRKLPNHIISDIIELNTSRNIIPMQVHQPNRRPIE